MNKYELDSTPSNLNGTPSHAFNEFESRIRHEHFRPREAEWLKRMQEYNNWPMLVIFGFNHFESFCNLLLDNGISVTTTESNWGSRNL